MAKQSLGRGFDILIPKEVDKSILEEDKHRVQKLLVTDIVPNPDQPRREFDEQALSELAESIRRHGVLQPIIVMRHDNKYHIVAGERRWRASVSAGLTHMPAIVRSLEELERVELSPLEQALSVYKLQQQFNLALEDVAKKLGKAPSTISNLTRLLQLPELARESLRTGKISEGHARAILALKGDLDKQEELLRCILNNGWSVRQAEQFVTSSKRGASISKARSSTASESAVTMNLSKHLSTPVSVNHTAKGGQLIISFKSETELNDLAAKILNNK
jgi:ParB family chromosome partitioning protein